MKVHVKWYGGPYYDYGYDPTRMEEFDSIKAASTQLYNRAFITGLALPFNYISGPENNRVAGVKDSYMTLYKPDTWNLYKPGTDKPFARLSLVAREDGSFRPSYKVIKDE